MNKKGFSLTELLTVVAILGVLGMIANAIYSSYIHSTKATIANVTIKEIQESFEACYRDREFSPYNDSTGNPVKPVDCFDEKIKGALKVNPKIIVTHNTDSGKTKGCWSVKVVDSKKHREGKQCVDFLLSDRGHKTNHLKDDGNNSGECQAGVCQ